MPGGVLAALSVGHQSLGGHHHLLLRRLAARTAGEANRVTEVEHPAGAGADTEVQLLPLQGPGPGPVPTASIARNAWSMLLGQGCLARHHKPGLQSGAVVVAPTDK